jgi:outer membrane protein assembly factor BamB
MSDRWDPQPGRRAPGNLASMPGAGRRPPGRPWLVPVIILASMLVTWAIVATTTRVDDGTAETADDGTPPPDGEGEGDGTEVPADDALPPLPPYDGWVNPASSGRPWGDTVNGVLTFRGNPTRSWYGTGPMPTAPQVLWSFPADDSMCGNSSDGGVTSTWCGMGWTGQPSVWQNEADGRTWLAFGAYDKAVHWLDAATGQRIMDDFPTGDIIKGSVTIDPDGFPLLYTGSRDDYFRIIAMDRGEPVELWKIHAESVSPTLWNDDWDGSALVIDDYLFEGGENSQFHIVKLNRGYDAAGKVTVNPELVFNTPGWDDELLSYITDRQVSIESSVAISGNTVYFANSGGLVQGWDITGLAEGVDPTRVFRFWTGDDTDATIAIDDQGMLYVGSEYERHNSRSQEVGQMMKLDPSKPDDPLVWSVDDQYSSGKSGVWATPAIWKDVVYFATNSGRVLGVDRATGQVLWEKEFGSQTWASPVVVDDVLIEGDCEGNLRAFDVRDTRIDPPQLWSVKLDGCIEATPAVWEGRIYVGTRGGKLYAIGQP